MIILAKKKKLLAICKILWYTIKVTWGCSSLGRALEWHSRGSRFDPDHLHQEKSTTSVVLFCFVRQTVFSAGLLDSQLVHNMESGARMPNFLPHGPDRSGASGSRELCPGDCRKVTLNKPRPGGERITMEDRQIWAGEQIVDNLFMDVQNCACILKP